MEILNNKKLKLLDVIVIVFFISTFFTFPDKKYIVYVGRIIFIVYMFIKNIVKSNLIVISQLKPVFFWGISFVISLLFSMVFSYNIMTSLSIWIALIQCMFIIYLLCWWIECDIDKLLFVLKTIVICGSAFAVRVVMNLGIRFGIKKIATILTLNVNTIGYRFALLFIICLFLFNRRQTKHKLLYVGLLLSFFLMIVITGSRRALILIVISTFLYMILSAKNPIKVLKIFIFLIIGVIGIYTLITKVNFLYNIIGERMLNTIDAFFNNDKVILDGGRDIMIERALNLFIQRPIFGWGMGNFRELSNIDIAYSHNNYAELLFATGLCGFISYYLIYFYIFKRFLQLRIKKNQLLAFGFSASIMMLISDFAAPSYYQSYLYLILSIIICTINIEDNERKKE